MQNNTQIAGAIVLAGLFIAGAILLKDSTGPSIPATQGTKSLASINARSVSADEHILGGSDAPVIIIEYSDTECPFCKVFHTTLQRVREQNGNNVAWVYRHFPIPSLHAKAFHEAEATECAWELGGNDGFWKYTDEVFKRTQSNDRLEVSELPKIAGDIGLNVASFNTCLASGKYKTKVETDMSDGVQAGVKGTPYSVIFSKKEITSKKQSEILGLLTNAGSVSFDSERKNVMSLNGALPFEIVSKVVVILLK